MLAIALVLATAAAPPVCDDVWTADPHVCVTTFATGVPGARGLAFAPNGDLFAVARDGGGLMVLWDANHDGRSDASERATFAKKGGNHGLAIHRGYVYASSDTEVFRYPYRRGDRHARGAPETVVRGIPAKGHITRTLLFDRAGRLLVSCGSAHNVDDVKAPETTRAVVRRFDLAKLPRGGFPWTGGETFATGLRNEVGLRLDPKGRVVGVENGRDQLIVHGDDIHDDNPAEEVNLFTTPGRFYGYPFCWSVWKWPGHGDAGTRHVDPDVSGGHDDAWCQDPKNVVPPVGTMPAHLAPLDLWFYEGAMFPEYKGSLFVTSHGSWNRNPQVGRMILRGEVLPNGQIGKLAPFVGEKGEGGELVQGTWKFRPVGLAVDARGALYFSDDASGTIHRISRR